MIYPSNSQEIKEQARYKIRLEQHAKDAGQTIEEYIRDSRYNYVILSNADQPEHWADEHGLMPFDGGEDETNWVVYGSRDEAENERQILISLRDFGHRVVTERYFLKMKGLLAR